MVIYIPKEKWAELELYKRSPEAREAALKALAQLKQAAARSEAAGGQRMSQALPPTNQMPEVPIDQVPQAPPQQPPEKPKKDNTMLWLIAGGVVLTAGAFWWEMTQGD